MAEATQAPPATGTFCWNELMTPDPQAARRFYTELFGWTAREVDLGEQGKYTILSNGDKDIGGLLKRPPAEIPPHWLSYVAVEDVDATTRMAERLGGKISVPPRDIPEVGRFAVLSDPTGAAIAVYKEA